MMSPRTKGPARKEKDMDEKNDAIYITLSDEEGNEHELEFISRITVEGRDYVSFFPADVDPNSKEANEIIMFRVVEENGEELFEIIEDDDEAEKVYEKFCDSLFDDEEEE